MTIAPVTAEFVVGVQGKVDAYMTAKFPNLPRETVGANAGRRFDKVWIDNGTQRFVHAFIERETGHVYKPEGWKKPAAGVRFTTVEAALNAWDSPGGGYLYR